MNCFYASAALLLCNTAASWLVTTGCFPQLLSPGLSWATHTHNPRPVHSVWWTYISSLSILSSTTPESPITIEIPGWNICGVVGCPIWMTPHNALRVLSQPLAPLQLGDHAGSQVYVCQILQPPPKKTGNWEGFFVLLLLLLICSLNL